MQTVFSRCRRGFASARRVKPDSGANRQATRALVHLTGAPITLTVPRDKRSMTAPTITSEEARIYESTVHSGPMNWWLIRHGTHEDLTGRRRKRRARPAPRRGRRLRKFHAAGVRIVTLGNGSRRVAESLLERAGVGDLVEQCLSVSDAGRWKPAPEAYAHAADRFAVEPVEVALIAVHP